MKKTLCVLTFLAVCLSFAEAVFADEPEKIKLLIIDGQNNHNWKATTPVLKDIYEKSGRFVVDIATSPAKGEDMSGFKPDFAKYGVLVMNYNGDSWTKETNDAFEKYVSNGGGLVSYHAGDNPFRDWKEYNEMIAIGGWGGRNENDGPYLYVKNGEVVRDTTPGSGGHHGPQVEFLIETFAPDHPIMKGLPKAFLHCKDELYCKLRGPAKNVDILGTALAKVNEGGTGNDEPMLMAITYGKGRVFHTTLGHDVPQCKCVGFQTTLLRGSEWAAIGSVTIPCPDDYPTADKTSVRP
ncbi:MAG: ThuA domain-containing protein [Planctomycetaceae bacterium]|jgi:type 1 glutamine amidotransferase|nr:ThuA domain-containing protein [Planctomycetaceae bacterium]